jgi:hypothetical protein
MNMNVKIVRCFNRIGLLCDLQIHATKLPVAEIASAEGHGCVSAYFCTASIVPKAESYDRSHYSTVIEEADILLAYNSMWALRYTRTGQADAADIKVAHVLMNIRECVVARNLNAAMMGGMLNAGWWRNANSNLDLAELASLLRVLDQAIKHPNDESAFADAENGKLVYAG